MKVAIETFDAGNDSLAAFLDVLLPGEWRSDYPATWAVVRDGDGSVLAAGAVSIGLLRTAWLDRGAVRPDRRGGGLHYVTARSRCAYAISRGVRVLETSILHDNGPSIATFRRLGFEPTSWPCRTDYIPFRKAVYR